jgi:hypothetical protein
VFSETRYAKNGNLRVAYRASEEGERDIVFVPNWFTCCELLPELPSLQGWVEAMSSLGRLIVFDHARTPCRSNSVVATLPVATLPVATLPVAVTAVPAWAPSAPVR